MNHDVLNVCYLCVSRLDELCYVVFFLNHMHPCWMIYDVMAWDPNTCIWIWSSNDWCEVLMNAWCMMACGHVSMRCCILRITYVIDWCGYVCPKWSAGLSWVSSAIILVVLWSMNFWWFENLTWIPWEHSMWGFEQ